MMDKVFMKLLQKLKIMDESEYYRRFWKMNIGE